MVKEPFVPGPLAKQPSLLVPKQSLLKTSEYSKTSTPSQQSYSLTRSDIMFECGMKWYSENLSSTTMVAETRVRSTSVVYTTKHVSLANRRLRLIIMSPKVSLSSFQRRYLYQLMVQNYESPFDDEDDEEDRDSELANEDYSVDVQIVISNPNRSSKHKLYEILERASPQPLFITNIAESSYLSIKAISPS
jgi:hypothetical protein